jgi:hypothetical protein
MVEVTLSLPVWAHRTFQRYHIPGVCTAAVPLDDPAVSTFFDSSGDLLPPPQAALLQGLIGVVRLRTRVCVGCCRCMKGRADGRCGLLERG